MCRNIFLFLCLLGVMTAFTDCFETTPLTSVTESYMDFCGKLSLPEKCKCPNDVSGARIGCYARGAKNFPQFNQIHLQVDTLRVEGMNATEFKGGQFFGWSVRKLVLRRDRIQIIDDLAFWGLEFQLEVLDLSRNHLYAVPSNSLRAMRALRVLKLSYNRISYLRSREFKQLVNLKALFLDKNPIYYVSLYAFVGSNLYVLSMNGVRLPQPKSRDGQVTRRLDNIPTHDFQHLRVFSLANASISTIPDGWFTRFHSLRYLNLNNNKIKKIRAKAFDGLGDTLSSLKLSGNKLEFVPKAAFLGFKRLEKLDLSRNRFGTIRQKSFFDMYSLNKLDLRHNNIEIVRPKAFYGLQQLEVLDLRHNIISWLTRQAISWSKAPNFKVYLSDNAWSCDCNLRWMRSEVKKNSSVVDLQSLRCSYPYYHRGERLVDVAPSRFICEDRYAYSDIDYPKYDDDETLSEDTDNINTY